MKTVWMSHIVAAMGVVFVLATMSSIALCAPKATITPAADTDNQQDGQLRTSIYERPIQDCDRLAYFKDMKELEAYFDSLNGSSPPSYFEGGSWMMRPVPSTTGPTLGFGGDDGSIDYSQTNVQVAGID